ncbi:MAG TPA: Ig-like domain-containing protein, partial [Oscillospiraceae bacterium]|nr:Ig-like domain-containing protein [Oscillospiraceae bacterium]
MKQKTISIVIFALLFLVIFNINPYMIIMVDASDKEPKLKWSNIDDGKDISIYETFEIDFDKEIELGSGTIELFNRSSSKKENIRITEIRYKTLKIRPINEMKYHSNYELVLGKGSIVDSYSNNVDKTSIKFTTEKKSESNDDNPKNIGETHGLRFGRIEGQLSGYMDSMSGKKNNCSSAIPSDKKIVNEYNLDKETVEFRNTFLKDFKESFKNAYERAFRDENFKDDLATKENGLVHGKIVGTLEGENQGNLDYINGKNNDWKSSISSDITIIQKYNLKRDYFGYRENFLMGYKDGFRESYNLAFRGQNLEVAEGNLNISYISMQGGEINSYDGAVKLKIEPGSFYEKTGISIEKNPPYENLYILDMIPVTNSYN